MIERVAFIGLGNMGRHMAARLVSAGFEVHGFDLQDPAVQFIVDRGGLRADTPAEAAKQVDVVITMLPSSPHVEEVICGSDGVLEGIKPGAVIIDMSTIDPRTSQRLARTSQDHGIRMIDAPVSRGQAAAITGDLLIMVGGPAEVLGECRPLLEVLGSTIIHVGESGMGTVAKLVNNMLVGCIIAATTEAFIYGIKSGAPADRLLEVVSQASGSSWILEHLFRGKGLEGDFEPGFFAEHMHKDLGLALLSAKESKVSLLLTAVAGELFSLVGAQGLGKKDAVVLLDVMGRLHGLQFPETTPATPQPGN